MSGRAEKLHTVGVLFTEDEWLAFTNALGARRALLDEGVRPLGERAWAEYIKGTMPALGLDDLAARIDPEDFEPGAAERLLALGRSNPLLVMASQTRRDVPGEGNS